MCSETKRGKKLRADFIKKVKPYRKDVGKGYENYKKEICIVKGRETAVKEAGMGAEVGLMG